MAFWLTLRCSAVSISGILIGAQLADPAELEAKPAIPRDERATPAPGRRVVGQSDRPNAERDPAYPKQAAGAASGLR